MEEAISDFALFALYPDHETARHLVEHNRESGNLRCHGDHFIFYARQTSRRRKGLAGFGSAPLNDILYPKGARYLCTVTLTEHGDVILYDNTAAIFRPHVSVTVTDAATDTPLVEYGTELDRPQRRVVPMFAASSFGEAGDVPVIRVAIGRDCVFLFRWLVPLPDEDAVAATRVRLARIHALDATRYEVGGLHDERGKRLTPRAKGTVPMPELPLLEREAPPRTHTYRRLPAAKPGGESRVFEVVDLGSGKVYAVKRIEVPANDIGACSEAKMLAKLRLQSLGAFSHPNIDAAAFVTSLALSPSPIHLFHALHRGSSKHFFTHLHATTPSSRPLRLPQAMALFARQMLAALVCLDRHGLAHGNIHPSNILYTPFPSPPVTEAADPVTFLLSDFPLGGAADRVGTVGYMAPETVRHGTRSGKADLYALGVSMLELLGAVSVDEFERGFKVWNGKLEGLTGRRPLRMATTDGLAGVEGEVGRFGHAQVRTLYENRILGAALGDLLVLPSERRQDAHKAVAMFERMGERAFYLDDVEP